MKKQLSITIITGLILVLCGELNAQTLQPMSSPYLDGIIETHMANAHIPGLSSCIVKEGQIRWIGAYGMANIEQDIPVDTSTLFMLASVSKTVTVTALMQLWEDDLFELDDDINDYLDFEVRHPIDSLEPITFKMLCTHTSSIKDNWGIMPYYWGEDSPIPLGEYLFHYLNKDGDNYNQYSNFYYYESPGSAYHYSNTGAALIGYLVEIMGDSTFSYQTQQNIFEPLGMNETSWFLSELDTLHIAMPYSWNGSGYTPYGHYGYSDYPAGQLRTSIDQLANFLLCYMNGGTVQGQQILQSSTVEMILTPQIPQINPNTGLIWFSGFYQGNMYWGHNGGDKGVKTSMFFRPDDDIGVIMLTNGESDFTYLASQIFDYAADSIEVHCLPEGITFTTQEEIDNFQINYPGCTEIEGNVTINGDDITNLNGLNVLMSVGGSFLIGDTIYPYIGNPYLTNFTGLENLASIGGSLEIYCNDSLKSLNGLEKLNSIMENLIIGFYYFTPVGPILGGNHSLSNITALSGLSSIGGDLIIMDNYALTDLAGFENLTSLGGDLWIGWNGLVSLTGLESLTSIPGSLYIGWGCGLNSGYLLNPNLETLSGLDNLTSIGGSLTIECCPVLNSLTGLDNLTSIGGYLSIGCNGLTSLTGLDNLTSLGGGLSIRKNHSITNLSGIENISSIEGALTIDHNTILNNLTSLHNLTSVGESLIIMHCFALDNLFGLEGLTSIGGSLTIQWNDALTSLTGLDNITSIEGNLRIYDNEALISIDAIEGVNSIGGNVWVKKNHALTNLTGLDNVTSIGSYLEIIENDALVSLAGLEELTSIGAHMLIESNTMLSNLMGLANLSSVNGEISIISNVSLSDIIGLENLVSIFGDLQIEDNISLTTISGLDNVDEIEGNIVIIDNTSLAGLTGLENLVSIFGDLLIEGNTALNNLSGLNNVEVIDGDLYVLDNFSMASFTGLGTLTSVEGDFVVVRSDSLTNFSGLDNLTSIGGSFVIGVSGYTGTFGNLSLTSLVGLVSLDSIGANLEIHNNYNLVGLTGLDSLTFVGGNLSIINNTSLISLTGIDSVEGGSIDDLEIKYNFSLSDCDAQSICEYLSSSPNGDVTIVGNAEGCDSQEEVQEHCLTKIEEYVSKEDLNIYPNPLESTAMIQYNLQTNSQVSLRILDLTGQETVTLVNEVQQQGEHQVVFNTGNLPAGIYFCVLKTNPACAGQTKKIIKL